MSKMKELMAQLDAPCYISQDDSLEMRKACEESGIKHSATFLSFRKKDDSTMIYVYDCGPCGCQHEVETPITDDCLEISTAPYNEECAQAGFPGYSATARLECRVLREELRQICGPEPEHAELRIKSMNGGEYIELVCCFNTEFPLSYAYALLCQDSVPANWSKASLTRLQLESFNNGYRNQYYNEGAYRAINNEVNQLKRIHVSKPHLVALLDLFLDHTKHKSSKERFLSVMVTVDSFTEKFGYAAGLDTLKSIIDRL